MIFVFTERIILEISREYNITCNIVKKHLTIFKDELGYYCTQIVIFVKKLHK